MQRGKPVFTAITDPDADRPAGLVNRQFRASAPNRLWDADITVVRTWQGFCYTACCGAGPRCRDQSPNDSNPADWLRTAHPWRCRRAGVGLKSGSITLLPNVTRHHSLVTERRIAMGPRGEGHLDDAEKALLERCSVFAGGFDLQSACAVA